MRKIKREKIIKILVIVLFMILVAVTATYAWVSTWNSVNNTELTLSYGTLADVTYLTGNDISIDNIGPVTSYEYGEVTEFIIRKRTSSSLGVSLDLTITEINSNLKVESFKWALLSSDDDIDYIVIDSGNFLNQAIGQMSLTQNYIISTSLTYYKFIIYIDGTMENNINMQSASFSGSLNVVIGNTRPLLADGMIPIYYDTNTDVWKKADSRNTSNSWYDYENKKWANAVLVTSATRGTYMGASVGTPITEADVLAYYVWIPRYRYQLFNATAAAISPEEIQIEFEIATTPKSAGDANDEWLTHPAFTFGTEELDGFWVGKFESTGDGTTPTVKPNLSSLKSQNVSTQFTTSQLFASTTYLTSTGLSQIDAHMMKNLEWGAVAYLSYSDYGKLAEVCINNSIGQDSYTGRSGGNVGGSCNIVSVQYPGQSGSTECYAYGYYTYNDYNILYGGTIDTNKTTGLGTCASTTGNVYGVYDMSGGTYEYVMGNYNGYSGYSVYSNSGFNGPTGGDSGTYSAGINFPASKYYDLYTGTSITANFKLGDATGETRSWFGDAAYFVDASNPWFVRSGHSSHGVTAGAFYSNSSYGAAGTASWRSVLS